jgi:hypothetical protein
MASRLLAMLAKERYGTTEVAVLRSPRTTAIGEIGGRARALNWSIAPKLRASPYLPQSDSAASDVIWPFSSSLMSP